MQSCTKSQAWDPFRNLCMVILPDWWRMGNFKGLGSDFGATLAQCLRPRLRATRLQGMAFTGLHQLVAYCIYAGICSWWLACLCSFWDGRGINLLKAYSVFSILRRISQHWTKTYNNEDSWGYATPLIVELMFHALPYSGHTQIPVPQDFPCITFSPFVLWSPDYSHLPDQGQLDRVETEPPGTGMTDTHRIHCCFFAVLRSMCWFSFVYLSKFSRHTQNDGASLGTKQCASETIEWKARWKGDGQPLCP